MMTVNSLSGGKSSSFMAVNYPAELEIFALVCCDDHQLRKTIDPGILREVRNKLDRYEGLYKQFNGTTEDPKILKVMLDLEQLIGREIIWVRGISWEQMLAKKKIIPNVAMRFCTTILKMIPIIEYLLMNHDFPVNMRIGFRWDEMERIGKQFFKKVSGKPKPSNEFDMQTVFDRLSIEFGETEEINQVMNFLKVKQLIPEGKLVFSDPSKFKLATSCNISRFSHSGKIHMNYSDFFWRKLSYPMVANGNHFSEVEDFWKNKRISFPEDSNCLNCFWKAPMQHRKNFDSNKKIMTWAMVQEEIIGGTFLKAQSLMTSKNMGLQMDFNFGGGSGCSSGGFCTD